MAFAPLPPELKQRALSIASSYKNGGSVKAPLKKAANVLEQQGRKGDTELVHVTPGELSLLETIGSGTTNPVTGLREFFAAGSDGPGSDTDDGGTSPAGDGPGSDGPGSDGPSVSDTAASEDIGAISGDPGRSPSVSDTAASEDIGAIPGEIGPSVPDTAASEDIGAIPGDRGTSPEASDRSGIAGMIDDALDQNKDGKVSAGEVALGVLAAVTPLGPLMGLAKGLENVATAVEFDTNIGSTQTGMIADQQRGLYGGEDEDDFGGGGDADRAGRPDVELEVPEELTFEELSKPPTIDIIPFRPEDFRYFTPGNFAYNRGIPSMMNMRTR